MGGTRDRKGVRVRLRICFMCGARRVERKEVTVRRRSGRMITGVIADVCAACGQRYFDMEAMRKIEGD